MFSPPRLLLDPHHLPTHSILHFSLSLKKSNQMKKKNSKTKKCQNKKKERNKSPPKKKPTEFV